jgi:hypothetical protein
MQLLDKLVVEVAGCRDWRHIGVVVEAGEEDQHVVVGAVDSFRGAFHVRVLVLPAVARGLEGGVVAGLAKLVAEGHAHEVAPGGALGWLVVCLVGFWWGVLRVGPCIGGLVSTSFRRSRCC